LHRRHAVGNGFQDAIDAVVESRDCFFDPRAAHLLLVEPRISAFDQSAFRNVVVDTDPIVRTGYRPIDDGNRAPVRRLVDKTDSLSGRDLAHDFFAILLRIVA